MGQVLHDVQGSLGIITFSNPSKRNALSIPMWRALPGAVRALVDSAAVQAIVLQGDGADFGSGADLADVLAATHDTASARAYCQMVLDALLAVAQCPRPTWALLRGLTIGGAAEIALAADCRMAIPGARFLLPFARLGVVPDLLTVRRLVGLVGLGRARQMLTEPRTQSDQECMALGLIDHLLTETDPLAELNRRATALGTLSRTAITQIKVLMRDVSATEHEAAIDAMAHSLVHGDAPNRLRQALADRHEIAGPQTQHP